MERKIYFVTDGSVNLYNNTTKTFIKTLEQDSTFGEIGFFSYRRRTCTVKSRFFTDILTLDREEVEEEI